ncbi:hypothetical protein AAFF_G00010080 [Aldrovandia affinis]|uniref:C2H2-type domain-containing protein n=1 Tax=Aldrovandia affinis TaxID=143900 RepID=A0AAD7WID9_9TELE|nr:hypothetical protein AAFF_G00010080 [Aldrovandia affinis]
MGRKRGRSGFTSPTASIKQEVVMVQGAESSDVPTSTPKVSADDHNYSIYPSQQVLSVLVRHTYNVSPEHEEGLYTCSYCRKQYSTKSWYIKHTKYLCEVKKKVEPQKLDSEDAPPLPRLRVRKQADLKQEEDPVQSQSPETNETEDSESDGEDSESEDSEGEDSEGKDSESEDSESEGHFICSSCGKQYRYESCYERHVRHCDQPKTKNLKMEDVSPLPRLRVRKQEDVKPEEGGHFICSSCGKQYRYEVCYEKHMRHCCQAKTKKLKVEVEVPPLDGDGKSRPPPSSFNHLRDASPEPGADPMQSHSPEASKSEDSKGECSFTISSSVKVEASDSWHKGVTDNNSKPNTNPVDLVLGHFICSSCGKQYRYEVCYKKHMRHCCQAKTKKLKMELKVPPLDGDDKSRPPPSSFNHLRDASPEPGVVSRDPCLEGSDPALPVQQWVKDSIPTEQLVYSCSVPYCGQSFIEEGALLDHQGEHSGLKYGRNKKRSRMSVCGEQPVRGTRYSQASAKSPEPSHTDCLSMIQISNVTSLVTSRDEFLRMTEEVAVSAGEEREPAGGDPPSGLGGKDVASCPGGRRVACLLCRKRFKPNKALDRHVASAHCERLQYPCASCNMSYKARTSLCRHTLQAHCDLKKLKCCVCKRRFGGAHHLQRHVLRQHCGQKHLSNPPLPQVTQPSLFCA